MNTNTKRSVFCPACSHRATAWGYTSSDARRYRCLSCRTTFRSFQKEAGKTRPFFFFFEQYILEGTPYRTLARWSGYSIQTLEHHFHHFLLNDPPPLFIPQPEAFEAYLILDGWWFGRKSCLMLYRQSRSKLLFHASWMSREWGTKITRDLRVLGAKGYRFTCVVSDGGTGIRKAVFVVYGHIPHQICLVHLHRQATSAMGRHPKDKRVRHLKRIADHLFLIESKEALAWWKTNLNGWIRTNWMYLHERRTDTDGHSWFVHTGVRKAVRTLLTAASSSFVFLDHPLLPKSTNELEGSISMLSMKHLVHRGLKEGRVPAFLAWYLYSYNRKILSQRKTKED